MNKMGCFVNLLNGFRDYVRNNVPEDYMLPISLDETSGKSVGAQHLHSDYDEWLPLLHVMLGLLDLGTTLWFYVFLLDRMRDRRDDRDGSDDEEEEYKTHLLYLYTTLFIFVLASFVNFILILVCGTPSSLFYSQKEIEEARGNVKYATFDSSHSVVIYGATGPNAEVVNGTYDKTEETKDGGYVYLKRSSHFRKKVYKRIYLQLDIDDEVDEPGTGRWTVLPADSKNQGSGLGWAGVPVDLLPSGSGAFIIESNHPYIIAHEPLKKTIKVHDAVGYVVNFDSRCSWGDSAILAFNFEGQNEAREHYLDDGTYRSIEITASEFIFYFDAGKDEREDETFWGFRIEVTPIFDTEPQDIIPSIVRTVGTYWNVHDTEDWVPHPEMNVEKFVEQDSFLLRLGAVDHTSWMYELYVICWRSLECWHLFENERIEREGSSDWKITDKVLALSKGATHYSPGYIIHMVDGKCDVNFENGNYETVDIASLRKPERNCTDTDEVSFYAIFPFHLLGVGIVFLTILIVGLITKYVKMVYFMFYYVFTIFRRAATFVFVLADSELSYLFYGRREFYAVMTLSGVYIGSAGMTFVQIFYMISMASFYDDSTPETMQYVSLFSSLLHLAFSGVYKHIFHYERPPPARSVLFVGRESEAIEQKREMLRTNKVVRPHSFQVHAQDLYAHRGLVDSEAKSESGTENDYRLVSRSVSGFTGFSSSRQTSGADWNSSSSPASPTVAESMKTPISPMSIASSGGFSFMTFTSDGASSKRKPISPSPTKKKQMARARKADNLTQSISL